jgi:hypothetical protein
MAGDVVRDLHPPRWLLRLLNPPFRALLRSPLGRVLPFPVAVLEFEGRRTGRRRRILANWHETDDGPAVFTPAPWGHNFAGGRPVTVVLRGRTLRGSGTLVDDPAAVAAALQRQIDRGTSARTFGVGMPPGHRLTADDVRAIGRRMIRFDVTPGGEGGRHPMGA